MENQCAKLIKLLIIRIGQSRFGSPELRVQAKGRRPIRVKEVIFLCFLKEVTDRLLLIGFFLRCTSCIMKWPT